MKNTPYTVLMSVYIKEKAEYLKLSIQSMLDQTVPPDEFILVKDGPLTMELDAVVDYYNQKYPGLFTIISNETNLGLGPALAKGIVTSRNELIARMDSDDISEKTRCEKQLLAFEKNTDLEMVGSFEAEFIGEKDNVVSIHRVPETHSDIAKFMRRRCAILHPTVMYKKGAVIRSGNYHSVPLYEDYDLFARMGVAAVWSNRKGLSTFIELERKLPKGYKIVLIGLNDRQIKELPKGILGLPKTFSVDELRNWYSCAEVFVNPTMEEVLGLVNIEAQACGTPVITYDTGGSVECVSNDTGFIVEQNNVHQLICKIETICEVSKSNYKLACITQSKNFDKDKKYMEYVELYEKIFNQSRRKS